MSESRFAILDPVAGISGDMVLGALLAAGARRNGCGDFPARLGLPDVTVEIERVDRGGLSCLKVNVRLPGGRMEPPTEPHTHPPTITTAITCSTRQSTTVPTGTWAN